MWRASGTFEAAADVGRGRVLRHLHGVLQVAQQRHRQVVYVQDVAEYQRYRLKPRTTHNSHTGARSIHHRHNKKITGIL